MATHKAHPASPGGMAPGRDTRARLLEAAIDEFCAHGRSGASTARIVEAAGCSIRMLYHYFGNKQGLYRAALLQVYDELRQAEARQDFNAAAPVEGISALVAFTFDYMAAHRRFPKMILTENLDGGGVVAAAREPFAGARPLIDTLETLIARGHAAGDFTRRPSALDLYLTILALSFIHVSNQHTLSSTFGQDLGAADFIARRRVHAIEVVLSYLGAPG